MKSLSFESESLFVDYLTFNIQSYVDLQSITDYLSRKLRFNSTIVQKINVKWKSESLVYHTQNQYTVSFR